MKKNKLIEMRNFKGFSQQQIAEQLRMGVTTYHRRENGQMPIDLPLWEKLAKILDVQLGEILEFDENQVFICNDNASIHNHGTNNIYTVPEIYPKYITSLEEKIAALEEEIATLKHKK